MSSRRRTLDEWRSVVFKSKNIKDGTRVTLLLLSDRMNANRVVSVPLVQVASALGKSKRSVLRHLSEAQDKGLLSTVSRGYVGHTAVYQGLFPDVESVTTVVTHPTPERVPKIDTLSESKVVTLSARESVTTVGTPYLQRTPAAGGHDSNDGSNKEQVPTSVASWLSCPVCEYDGCSRCA